MLSASRKKTTVSWLHGCGLSRGESNFCPHTSFFKVVPPVGFNRTSFVTETEPNTLSQELMHSSASSQQVSTFIHIPQTHLTCLFPLSSPLSSYGGSLPRFAPNLHLHPDTALITKQGDWVNYLHHCQYRHKPSPGSALVCAALFYTHASEDSCSIVSPLTSYC